MHKVTWKIVHTQVLTTVVLKKKIIATYLLRNASYQQITSVPKPFVKSLQVMVLLESEWNVAISAHMRVTRGTYNIAPTT